MLRYFFVVASLALVPAAVYGYSAGAPETICGNDLVPEHHVDGQTSAAPYSFSGGSNVRAGDKLSLTLGGDKFLGWAIQARDEKNQPIGQFKIVESNKSQTIKCKGPNDTLTHKKIPSDKAINRLEFEWEAPQNYKGKVKFVGTVVKNGGTFWIRKVLKDVNVQ